MMKAPYQRPALQEEVRPLGAADLRMQRRHLKGCWICSNRNANRHLRQLQPEGIPRIRGVQAAKRTMNLS